MSKSIFPPAFGTNAFSKSLFDASNLTRFADVLALSATMPKPTYGVISIANADGANNAAAINKAIFFFIVSPLVIIGYEYL